MTILTVTISEEDLHHHPSQSSGRNSPFAEHAERKKETERANDGEKEEGQIVYQHGSEADQDGAVRQQHSGNAWEEEAGANLCTTMR
jgi:hypothetical protein